jgi:hypothetical protein
MSLVPPLCLPRVTRDFADNCSADRYIVSLLCMTMKRHKYLSNAWWSTEVASARWFRKTQVCRACGCRYTGSTIDTPIPRGFFVWSKASLIIRLPASSASYSFTLLQSPYLRCSSHSVAYGTRISLQDVGAARWDVSMRWPTKLALTRCFGKTQVCCACGCRCTGDTPTPRGLRFVGIGRLTE